jgi:hypothetical protein
MFDKIGSNLKKYNVYKDGPTLSFHRRKLIFDYNPEKCIEEQPTFTFENDRNIKLYKGYIENQAKAIDRYSQNYVNYMKGKENLKMSTPYNNNYNNQLQNNNLDNKVSLSKSQSFSPSYNKDDFIMKGRTTEITNPDKYYQSENQNYLKFKEEQRKYLDFNYNMMKNRSHQLLVNPYNKGSSTGDLGKSFLSNNPILNPFPNYNNKYFGNYFKVGKNNNNNNYGNSNSLRQAGNNFIIGN